MKRLRGFVGVFLIFFFGIVVGAALTGGTIWKEMHDMIEGGPDAVVGKIADRLGKDLKLDEAQKPMLAQIVTDARVKLRVLRAEKQPQVEEVLAEAEQKIRAVLNAPQQEKFDRILEKSGGKWRAKMATP